MFTTAGAGPAQEHAMTKPIATISTVFAACERLEAANERWNRDDVRREVGGGGFVVIDPLIRAWRALKPLRDAAPNTPAELLHQVATSLEAHVAGFTAEAEERLAEYQQVFEATVAELSERMAGLESDLEETTTSLQGVESEKARLAGALAERDVELAEAQTLISMQALESDGLKDRIARLEKEHAATVRALQAEQGELVLQHDRERTRLSEEHVATLAAQRKELIAAAEQAENRLLVLLDQERQEAKATAARLSDELAQARGMAQASREAGLELKATVNSLSRQNEKLEQAVSDREKHHRELQTQLESSQRRAATVERDFAAYKEAYQLSSDLGALQAAVAGLQAQLNDRNDEAGEAPS
jgi:chromosome segregation ATPase